MNSGSVGLTLMDKEDGIPDRWVLGERDDIHPKWTVRLISQGSILQGDGSAGEVVEGSRPRTGYTRSFFRRCTSAQEASLRSRARA